MPLCNSQASCYQEALMIESAAANQSVYSPNLFPLTGTNLTLNISMVIYIYKLLTLGNDKTLSVAMEVDLIWKDPNFPGAWSNLPYYTQLFVDASTMWTVNLYIANPADSNIYLKPDGLVYVFPTADGSPGAMVQGSIIGEFSSSCDTMDLADFPFDSQTCTMVLEYGDSPIIPNVQFVMPAPLYINDNPGNSEWTMTNASTAASPNSMSGGISIGFQVMFWLTRKSAYYNVFLVIPVVLLLSVGVLTVILPSDRGEKVVLGATLVIAMYVLFASITQQIPQIEDNHVPRIVVALEIGTLMNAIALAEAVVIQTLRILAHDLPGDVHRMLDPTLWKLFFNKLMNTFKFKPNQNQKESGDSSSRSYRVGAEKSKFERSGTSTTSTSITSDSNGTIMTDLSHHSTSTVLNSNSFSAFDSHQSDDLPSHGLSEPSGIALAPFTPEYMLVQQMLSDLEAKRKKERIRTVWRKLEYIMNFFTFASYVGLLWYYFGSFIYST